jgi:hypothetical protein
VPLNNGLLVRYELPLTATSRLVQGPTWRSRRAPSDAWCHVVALGSGEFLTTDGAHGLTRWRWEQGKDFEVKLPPRREEPPSAELPARLVTAPLLLPRADGAPLRILCADTRGVVTLLKGDDLIPERTWDLKGEVTAGPFLRGSEVGVVVDDTRLVWLDPTKDGTRWDFRTPGEHLVGEPRVIDGLVVLCDEGGRFVGIDPKTGKRQGEGYTLKAAVAPAGTPVPFGPGRVFAPLTDGTIMLLSLNRLKDKK